MEDFPFAPDLSGLKKRNEGRPRIVGDIMLYPHRSARRHWGKLSNPLRQLQKIGFLPQEMSIFDYGCGKGVDLHHLSEQGY